MEQSTILNYKSKELKSIQIENFIIHSVVEQLKSDFPQAESVKLNINLINDICDAIEEVVKSNGLKVVKIELFFKIYERVFGKVNEEQKVYIVNTINHLHENGHIRVVPKLVKFLKWLRSFFLKRN